MRNTCLALINTILIVLVLSTSAMALPLLSDILGYNCGYFADTGAEAVVLTDTDGIEDDSTFFLYLELAGFADTNTFGIYSYTLDESGNVIGVIDTLQVFAGDDSPGSFIPTSVEVSFDLDTGTATCGSNTALIGSTFGFYLTTTEGNGYTYYSHTALNSDNFDHFLIFDTRLGNIGGSDIVVAMEDLYGGGDQDYDDMVIGATDVAPVPEPATLLLIGSGLLGIGAFRKKKVNV